MPLEVEKRREQRMLEQVFRTIIANDVFKQVHFSCSASFLIIILRIMRHQTMIIELKPALVPIFLHIDAMVEMTRQNVGRNIGNRRYIVFIHMANITASFEK